MISYTELDEEWGQVSPTALAVHYQSGLSMATDPGTLTSHLGDERPAHAEYQHGKRAMQNTVPLLLAILFVLLMPLNAQRCDRCMKDGIEIPISLAKSTIRTPEFPVRRTTDYNIVIDVRWLLPAAELRCKMGFAVSLSDNDCTGESPLKLSWRVLDGNQIVAEGGDDGRNAAFDADSRSLIKHIGRFKGKAKHRYVVEVTVKQDASQLNVTQPHLIVETPDSW